MAIVIPIQYNGFSQSDLREQETDRSQSGDEDDSFSLKERLTTNDNTSSPDNQLRLEEAPSNNDNIFLEELEQSREEKDDTSAAPSDHSVEHDYVMVPRHEPFTVQEITADPNHNSNDHNVDMQIDAAMEEEEKVEEFMPIPSLFDDESTPVLFSQADTSVALEQDSEQKYGGLSNLGNTCYMASALQMIASLDCFVDDLRNRTPPSPSPEIHNNSNVADGNDATSEQEALMSDATAVEPSTKTLRDALLEVLEKLSRGETVRPEELKRCIDDRTGLFFGYRQQDSHEFLTTLLDLIDEEYKIKKEQESKDETSLAEVTSASDEKDRNNDAIEKDGDETPSGVQDDTTDDAELFSSVNENFNINASNGHEHGSVLKRQRVDETEAPHLNEEPTAKGVEGVDGQVLDDSVSVSRSSSFINLNYEDIEELLYGDTNESSIKGQESLGTMTEEPKCKLVGGRMNTSNAELTRYDDSQPVNMEDTILSDSSNKTDGINAEMTEELDEIMSPVDSNFTTEVRVSLTCESCKFRRSHTETFLHLSLEIGSACCSNVDDCIRKFFAPEKREIKCEKCFHTCATQTMEITKLPKALLFHLKRFIVDISPDYTSISYRKDQSAISFEERIPLENGGDGLFEEFLSPDLGVRTGSYYSIRSVVNHIGSSASCGHYTADAKRRYDSDMGKNDGREWTRFNDSFVSKVSSEEAVASSSHTAYMILYELEE